MADLDWAIKLSDLSKKRNILTTYMNKSVSIELLSKYRVELMGVAMMWILLFHAQISIPKSLAILEYIKITGYAGVDIFFLVSGFGLVFSLSKNPNIIDFWTKRFIRIVPAYWICLILIQAKNLWLDKFTIKDVFLSWFGLDFIVFGELSTWFIPAIIICYLFFPFYYRLCNQYGILKIFLIFVSASLILSLSIANSPLQHFMIFTIRLPAFFIGAYLGQLMVAEKKISIFNNIYLLLFILIVLIFWLLWIFDNTKTMQELFATGSWWYPTSLMSYPLSLLLCLVISKIDKMFHVALELIKPFGIYSLELYLTHTTLFSIANQLPFGRIKYSFFGIPKYLILILVALFISMLINVVVNKSIKLISHKQIG